MKALSNRPTPTRNPPASRLQLGAPEWFILSGATLFVFILWLSAVFQADIRWLHFFQSWMYVAALWLSLRGNRWGYFIGASAALLWDYINLFVTTFFAAGLHWLQSWILTGEMRHVDLLIAVPAWAGNLLLVIGAVWAYSRLRQRDRMDALRFCAAFALTTGFFAAAVAVCQPRYLPLFRGIFHPHRPW